jgi:hypothetical protein
MSDNLPWRTRALRRVTRMLGQGYLPLAFAPFIMWIAYAYAGEPGLVAVGGAVSVYMLALAFLGPSRPVVQVRDMVTGLDLRDEFLEKTEEILGHCTQTGRTTAVYTIEIDDYEKLVERYGQTTCDRVLETVADRIMI